MSRDLKSHGNLETVRTQIGLHAVLNSCSWGTIFVIRERVLSRFVFTFIFVSREFVIFALCADVCLVDPIVIGG